MKTKDFIIVLICLIFTTSIFSTMSYVEGLRQGKLALNAVEKDFITWNNYFYEHEGQHPRTKEWFGKQKYSLSVAELRKIGIHDYDKFVKTIRWFKGYAGHKRKRAKDYDHVIFMMEKYKFELTGIRDETTD